LNDLRPNGIACELGALEKPPVAFQISGAIGFQPDQRDMAVPQPDQLARGVPAHRFHVHHHARKIAAFMARSGDHRRDVMRREPALDDARGVHQDPHAVGILSDQAGQRPLRAGTEIVDAVMNLKIVTVLEELEA